MNLHLQLISMKNQSPKSGTDTEKFLLKKLTGLGKACVGTRLIEIAGYNLGGIGSFNA